MECSRLSYSIAGTGQEIVFTASGSVRAHKLLDFIAEATILEKERAASADLRSNIHIAPFGMTPLKSGELEVDSATKFPGRIVYNRCSQTARFELMEGAFTRDHAVLAARRCFCYSLLPFLDTGKAALIHGALLEWSGSGEAIVLFGNSGVGKSTAMKRFIREGGVGLADDKILLSLDDSGFLLAQPLPTWSYWKSYVDAGVPVRLNRPVKVAALLSLSRGEGNRIEAMKPPIWELELVRALIFHFRAPWRFLPKDAERQVAEKMMIFKNRLRRKFGYWTLRGDRECTLFPHLHEFVYGEKII